MPRLVGPCKRSCLQGLVRFGLISVLLHTLSYGADCNQNESEDSDDIAAATSVDCNANGVPDECEFPPLDYFPGIEVPLLENPRGLSIVDMNGDGIADLVSGTRASNLASTVDIALSRGDGTFDEPRKSSAGRSLLDLTVADLDGDGDNDVIANSRRAFQILTNPGDAELASPIEIPAPTSTRTVSARDLTGDGLLDLVVPHRGGVSMLENLGDLTFAEATLISDAGDAALATTADFDGDGSVDLALSNVLDNAIAILLNRDGTFTLTKTPAASEGLPLWLTTEDFDRDGTTDIGVGTEAGIFLLRNEGNATFQAAVQLARAFESIAAGDVDRDGDADLVLEQDDVFSALTNTGSGSFIGPSVIGTMRQTETIALGDLNGDGDIDVGVLTVRPNAFQVLWSGESTQLTFEPSTSAIRERPHSLRSGDFTGDGILDFATSNGHLQTVSIIPGTGDGGLLPAQHFRSPHSRLAGQFQTLTSGDVDRDGDLDVATSDREGDTIHVFLNDGGGRFNEVIPYPTATGPYSAVIFDIDGDNAPELVSINAAAQSLTVHFNSGDGTPDARREVELPGAGRFFTPIDVDGDGDLDVGASLSGSREIGILLNEGNRTFAPVRAFPVLTALDYITTADFDGDGSADLVTVAGNGGAVYLNRGDGTFGDDLSYDAGEALWSATPGDLDQDGRVDLVTANGGSEANDSISVLMGLGDGTFQAPRMFTVGSEPRFVVIVDLDDDGDTDIISANRKSMDMTVLQNQSSFDVFEEPFLETVCTPLDFHMVSFSSGSSTPGAAGVDRVTRYITPARDAADTLPTLFQNVARFTSDEDFLTTVFPDRFPELTAADFERLVAPRSSRQYYAGSVGRLFTPDGIAYGFTVVTDPAESPTLAEVTGVFETLRVSFRLEPFGYLPDTPQARETARGWQDVSFPIYLTDEDQEPTDQEFRFELVVPPETTLCGTFAEAGISRGPREEYELKSQVSLRSGTFQLSSAAESIQLDLADHVLFGPERQSATAVAPGAFRLQRIPRADFTVFRYTYEQEFALPDDRRFVVELVRPLDFRVAGTETLAGTIVMDEAYFTARPDDEALVASLDGQVLVRYGSCGYESLPAWDIAFMASDGTQARLRERWSEVDSRTETAPAALVRAEVELGATRYEVSAYWDLVYSARRHNRGAEYWVVLASPATVVGVEGKIHALELVAPDTDLGIETAMAYLGPDFEVLKSPAVTSFTKEPAGEEILFRRGDPDLDGVIGLGDGLALLDEIFRRGMPLTCRKSADWNDSGTINLVDVVSLLTFVFRDGTPPAEPFVDCGIDRTTDGLNCDAYPTCR